MTLNRLHQIIGIFTLFVFLGTGAYMRFSFPELYGDNESIRYLYRANHIYILCAALVNLVLGSYFEVRSEVWVKRLQTAGSLLLVLAPVLLVLAFFWEPPKAVPERPMTFLGIQALFAGAMLHLPAAFKRD